jgi:hypothetical protein
MMYSDTSLVKFNSLAATSACSVHRSSVLAVFEADFSEEEMSLDSEYQCKSPNIRIIFFSLGDSPHINFMSPYNQDLTQFPSNTSGTLNFLVNSDNKPCYSAVLSHSVFQ